MTPYTLYNVALAALIVPLGLWLLRRSRRTLSFTLAVRVSTLLTLISYPWDFFAIRMGVWRYPNDPGTTLYEVPLNDLIFIWLCTFLSSTVLITLGAGQPNRERHAESEDARQEDARNERRRPTRLTAPVIE